MDLREKARENILVLRCQAGDQEAFTCLFERYHGPVKYYLRRLLDSPETADDVLQMVWLKVLRKVKRLRRPDAFRTWLYRVARNEGLQQLRRARRWAEVEESLPTPEVAEDVAVFTPADAARVHEALGHLSAHHREVLVLRYLEELSYEEIASVVSCELGTVRSRIHYAKRALKRALEEWNDDK